MNISDIPDDVDENNVIKNSIPVVYTTYNTKEVFEFVFNNNEDAVANFINRYIEFTIDIVNNVGILIELSNDIGIIKELVDESSYKSVDEYAKNWDDDSMVKLVEKLLIYGNNNQSKFIKSIINVNKTICILAITSIQKYNLQIFDLVKNNKDIYDNSRFNSYNDLLIVNVLLFGYSENNIDLDDKIFKDYLSDITGKSNNEISNIISKFEDGEKSIPLLDDLFGKIMLSFLYEYKVDEVINYYKNNTEGIDDIVHIINNV